MAAIPKLRGTTALALLDRIFTTASSVNRPERDSLPLLVAIDTEANQECILELGIATFDPRCLLLPLDSGQEVPTSPIITYCYTKSGRRSRHKCKQFRFGVTQRFREAELRNIIESHLEPEDHNGQPRKVILIGHSICSDIILLERYSDIDLCHMTQIQAILDAQTVARPIFDTARPPKLKWLLEIFHLDYICLHNAAHDSRYTLRVLLMMFVKFRQSSRAHETEQKVQMISKIEDIARFHKVKERQTWCESKRVKMTHTPDLFEQSLDEDESEDGGVLTLLS